MFNTKRLADGALDRHKARLVGQGYAQRPGFDYVETCAPTVCMATLRTIRALYCWAGELGDCGCGHILGIHQW